MHGSSAPQAALSSSMSHIADQHSDPSIQPSRNVPAGYTQVPISIIVFHRRLTGRGSRPQLPQSPSSMPAPALTGVSGGGASVHLSGSNFLSLGRASSVVAGDMVTNPSQLATPDKYNPEHAPIQLSSSGLEDEASNIGKGTEGSQLQHFATTVSQGADPLLAEGSTDENMHMYQLLQKTSGTQINQSEHTPFSAPAIFKEKTLTQIEMQIAGAEKTETIRNEETQTRKLKTRRKRHRPKVIREDRLAKVQKPLDSTQDGKSLNQKLKRRYVRKKRNLSSLEKCSGPVSDESISKGAENEARSRTATVQRRLHFESKEKGVQGDNSSMDNSLHCKYEKLVATQSTFCSVSESEMQIGHGLLVDMDNSPGGLAFGMSIKQDKLLDEYIRLPEITPKPTQEISNETSGSFSRELARERDNMERTSEEWAGVAVMEKIKKDLEFKYANADCFHCPARSIPEMEFTRSQMSKVSEVENHTHHNGGESSQTGTTDAIILRTAAEMLAFCQAGGIKKKRSARIRRSTFVSIMDFENNNLQTSTRLPQSCKDALYGNSYTKFMTKKRSQKARPHCPGFIQPNMELENRLSDGGIFYDGFNRSKISEESFQKLSPQTLDKRSNPDIHCEVSEGSSANTSAGPYMDYLQGVASQLKHLDLNIGQVHGTGMHLSQTTPAVISFGGTDGISSALVPYGGGFIVPFERPLQLVKKQRPRAKVNLDFETMRVWNLLMGKESEPVDGTDVEKERWWQQEREIFQGRAHSFVARMRLVQGDRRFSPWKGSVVDSVVGVFLTQNVADHLSSSAYMALAARFPSHSVNINCKDGTANQENEQTINAGVLGEKSVFDLFCNGVIHEIGVGYEELSISYEKIHVEPKDNITTSEIIKGENYSFNCKSASGSICNHQGAGIERKEQQFPDLSFVELNASTEVLQQIQFQQDISSSQCVTSENPQPTLPLSSEIPKYGVGGCSSAPYQQLESNFDHGKSVTGNDSTINESECHRLSTDNYDFDKPEVPSSPHVPFISTVDPQHLNMRIEPNISSISSNSSSGSAPQNLKNGTIETEKPLLMPLDSNVVSYSGIRTAGATLDSSKTTTNLRGQQSSGSSIIGKWNVLTASQKLDSHAVKLHHDNWTSFEASDLREHESLFAAVEMERKTTRKEDGYTLKSDFSFYAGGQDTESQASRPKKTRTTSKKNMGNFDWDKLRRQASSEGQIKERSFERRDSVDWEAVRCADVQQISHAIRERGMNNILAERIQNFLNRLVRDHGSIDLEWLRDIPPDSAKDYLLSIRGLGLKSVECVRLLTLHHLAFPVDTNVGRICVRLGWVPIQPLPESLQLHLLELYPVLETIQKYLWPRLCKLDQQTLYELHYHMITFGKVFCTKSKPNCNACPMRSECKHFASAFASARLALPCPQEKSLVKSRNQFDFQNSSMHALSSAHLPRLEGSIHARDFLPKNSEPIIEEPASPREEECLKSVENDIEDFDEDGEIPTIKLNMEAFAHNLENCIKESNKELQSDDIAKALVAISTEAASIPVPKLKNVHRLRTEHYVYELPDSHPLLQQLGLDQREPDDPTPYLLAIWTPGEIKEISKAPKSCCDPQMEGGLCNNEICYYCTSEKERQSRYVRGTILVPCRTAMRGSFPLNGTYFQVNEVFADHKSSHNPIHIERELLWNLQRRMVFFGTSVPTIFKGLTTEEIQQCFWRGFVCVRGFDIETRAPRPLCPHLHVVARPNSRKTAATEQAL